MAKEYIVPQHKHDPELTDEYKLMIDRTITEEENGKGKYISFDDNKDQFMKK
jgi:hypothetical protein